MKKTRLISLIMALIVCAMALPGAAMAHGAWFARRSDRIQLVCGEGWKDNAYDPDGLTDALETFCRELEEALADYPQLKVSFGSSQAVLTGEANDRSGQTAAWLAEHAWRVYVAVPAGDESAYEQTLRAAGLPAGRLVPVTEAPAGAGENWAVLTRTPTE